MHWSDWLSIVIAALACIWLAYCVLGDAVRQRFRRRRRCPKCWYDMSGTPGLRCSECGHAAKRERQLYRFRIRWWRGNCAAILLIGSWTAYRWTEMRARGWPAMIPTTALIEIVPRGDFDHLFPSTPFGPRRAPKGSPTPLMDQLYWELHDRVGSERFLPFQCRHLASLIGDEGHLTRIYTPSKPAEFFVGDPWSALGSAAAKSTHNKILRSYLVDLYGYTRDAWPVNVPITMCFRFSGITIFTPEGRVERTHGLLVPMGPYEEEIELGIRLDPPLTPAELAEKQPWTRPSAREHPMWGDFQVVIAHATGEQDGLHYRAEFERLLMPATLTAEPKTISLSYPVVVPTQVRGRIEEYLTPVEEPEIEALLREGLNPTLILVDETPALSLKFEAFHRVLSGRADHTIALDFTVVMDGEEIGRGYAWWWVYDRPGGIPFIDREVQPGGYFIRLEGPISEWTTLPTDANLTLRMESNAALALRNFDCDRYWEGSVEVPLGVEGE